MEKEQKEPRGKRGSVLGAIGAALALLVSMLVPTAALAAPPQAGSYVGTSSAYTGATFNFDIDANGVMSNFDATSYCFDGMFTQPVIWAGGPSTPIEAGQPFDLEWEYTVDGFGTYYELQGTVNADGTASGTGRAGFLPTGTCGGSSFTWTAAIGGGGGDPQPQTPEVILEKSAYYDKEIQNVGIMIRGEGFPADTDVTVTIHQVNGNVERYNTVVRSDANGEVYDRYVGWLEHQALNVNHRVTLSAEVGGQVYTDQKSFRADPGGDGPFWYFDGRDMTVTPEEVALTELANDGVRVQSTNMDGRESTAQLIVNGKIVGEVPVVEIAGQFGEVDYQYLSNDLLAGEHEIALRTVHKDDSLNTRTWERVAWTTLAVTEDLVIPDPTAVTPIAPTRDGNTITIPVVEGITYRDGASATLSGTVTLTEGQTLSVTATADEGYVLTDDVSEWTFTYESDEPELLEVIATAPTRDGNTVTIPVVEGVIYEDGTGAVLSGDVVLEIGQTLTVIATADEGFVLADGAHEWTFTYESDEPDLIEVVAAAPSRDGNTVTIPVVEGITYVDASNAPMTGVVELQDGETLTVTATANEGYVLADGAHEWVFTYEPEEPELIEVVAAAPTRDGNTVAIPVVTGVTYVDAADAVLSGSVTLDEGQTLTVRATADDGYELADGTHEWTFAYEADDPEPVEVTAEAPTRDGNIVMIPVVEGVTYVDGIGETLTGAVEIVEGETLTVTATADDGYELAPGVHEWTFAYEAETPDPVEVVAAPPVQVDNLVTIPVVEGITYVDGGGTVLAGLVELQDGETLTVTATADDGYVLADGTHEWTFTYEEDAPEPGTIPGVTPLEEDLDPALKGAITVPDTAVAGEPITVFIDGASEGDKVGVWLFSDPVYLGTYTVGAAGMVTVTIPADTPAGDHKIAVWAADTEALIGWDSITITAADAPSEGDGRAGADAAGGIAATGSSDVGLVLGLGALLMAAGVAFTVIRRRSVKQ